MYIEVEQFAEADRPEIEALQFFMEVLYFATALLVALIVTLKLDFPATRYWLLPVIAVMVEFVS